LILRKPLSGNWEWDSEERKIRTGIHIKQQINQKLFLKKKSGLTFFGKVAIAASFILIASLGLMFIKRMPQISNDRNVDRDLVVLEENSNDNITLTLSNGEVVELDELKAGTISKLNGIQIKKLPDGQISYENLAGIAGQETVNTNTINIPVGKHLQLTLSDGTRVWLNAASSFTYPIVFNVHERLVALNGEAYFDVKHDANKPFKINAHDTQINVTGTSFNVSAYKSDQKVTTTLFKGGVNVKKGNNEVHLLPGFQAISYENKEKISHVKANMDHAIAWRKGYFVFDDQDIVSVMRNVARWYDIRISVEGAVATQKIGGTFPLSADIDELLFDLNALGHFKIIKNGKEVKVMQMR